MSCAPQAWAAGSVLLLLQSCLGLEVRAAPILPEFLREVQIMGLRVGEAILDLALTRHRDDVGINVLRRDGPVSVVTVN